QSFDMGSYPGAVYQADSATHVHGSVFDISNQKEAILTYLDYYEGVGDQFEQPTEYIRAIVPVQFNGDTTDCWIYLYNLQTDDKPLIDSGDYSIHIGKPFSWPA
ncbi:MAG: gamma-glutamylcyclotransferase, partial [Cytophagaceae bacterium]